MSVPSSRLPHYAYVSPEVAEQHAKDTEEGFYDLFDAEVYWKDRYHFLNHHGYALRPRYHPDWKPSWIGTNIDPVFCEDSISIIVCAHFCLQVRPYLIMTIADTPCNRRNSAFRQLPRLYQEHKE